MRRSVGRFLALSASLPLTVFPACLARRFFSRSGPGAFADFEPGKAPHHDVLAELRHFRGDELADGQAARKVLDEPLLVKAIVLVEVSELAGDNALHHLRGFS